MSRLNQLAINDEGFIFDPSTGESFTVNSTGLTILKGLKENKSTGEIAEAIREQFDTSPEDVERDVMDFISHLRTYHLI
jgi:PqqD family protein of HPr-rel-A system